MKASVVLGTCLATAALTNPVFAAEGDVSVNDGQNELITRLHERSTVKLPPVPQRPSVTTQTPERSDSSGYSPAPAPYVFSPSDVPVRNEVLNMFCEDSVRDLCRDVVVPGYVLEQVEEPVPQVPVAAPAPARPQLTMWIVQQAFAEVPVPPAEIDVQPPDGETLVNFPTIFSTQAAEFTESLVLLGYRVDLRISPASYTWVHGDGTRQTTDSPGRAWSKGVPMSEYISHEYEKTAKDLGVRVDVTWTADFRVDGGAWQPVNGTVTVTGPEEQLDVLEADPLLVGDR